ncbi:hypothetical protein CY34DRAFT_805554 [Suillus luteus UH-Slu-Lm8-n1]|uniref:Uncharacterized protein n=1 Tax=Suillus luteus UH-Slu-Lm8-n1 TaxID=930992 RepID=A0A0D0AJ20_9AGAM|nr:hypothetical protein CY34DRAFT_805554 [Suillus luteus UH-Slu-Lm8-n1]
MHLSFRVVLAAVAALTVSMAVSADSAKCGLSGDFCNTQKDCCHSYECIEVINRHFDEVSMTWSSFIQDLLTPRHRSPLGVLDVKSSE